MYADWLSENGQEEHGEFVAASLALAEGDETKRPRVDELLRRLEPQLRRAGKCPECGGTGLALVVGRPASLRCPPCWGTGDRGGLLEEQDGVGAKPGAFHYRVTWERGFPGIVHSPLSDVFRLVEWPGNQARWVPTPTALAWAREWPLMKIAVPEADREQLRAIVPLDYMANGDESKAVVRWLRSLASSPRDI